LGLAKVTSKCQITIPKEIRDSLGISPSDYVIVVVDGDKAILRPVRKESIAGLRGRLPASRAFTSSDDTRREVGRQLGRRHRQTAT
jgi:AbrB family looped-hinge helix DNA binding protein